MAADPQRHLVSVWNPSYATNAMEEHLAILLGMARGEKDPDQIYVWWGKVRSPNRQQRLAHADHLDQLEAELAENPDREVHLYLTDYRSLNVGHVDQITAQDVTETDPEHVPPYYSRESLNCDCWFKLLDIRRLVQDDTLAVIAELKKLRNLHYEDRPVSLYGGMVDLPLVVSRPDAARFFDDESRDALLGGRLWAEFDAEAGGAGAMQRELRENLFGERAWAAFDPATQAFLATAEKVFRDHRNDEGFDFQSVMTGYAKALELESNRILRKLLEKAPKALVMENLDGVSRDLRRQRLTLGQFPRAIGGDEGRAKYLANLSTNGGWIVYQYPAILEAFVREVRNPGTHQQRVDRRTATRWRDRLAGVGCDGVLVELSGCLRTPAR